MKIFGCFVVDLYDDEFYRSLFVQTSVKLAQLNEVFGQEISFLWLLR